MLKYGFLLRETMTTSNQEIIFLGPVRKKMMEQTIFGIFIMV
jgi:hypothetical protein